MNFGVQWDEVKKKRKKKKEKKKENKFKLNYDTFFNN